MHTDLTSLTSNYASHVDALTFVSNNQTALAAVTELIDVDAEGNASSKVSMKSDVDGKFAEIYTWAGYEYNEETGKKELGSRIALNADVTEINSKITTINSDITTIKSRTTTVEGKLKVVEDIEGSFLKVNGGVIANTVSAGQITMGDNTYPAGEGLSNLVVTVSHWHAVSVDETKGTVTIGTAQTGAYNAKQATFNIADTKFYQDAVSAEKITSIGAGLYVGSGTLKSASASKSGTDLRITVNAYNENNVSKAREYFKIDASSVFEDGKKDADVVVTTAVTKITWDSDNNTFKSGGVQVDAANASNANKNYSGYIGVGIDADALKAAEDYWKKQGGSADIKNITVSDPANTTWNKNSGDVSAEFTLKALDDTGTALYTKSKATISISAIDAYNAGAATGFGRNYVFDAALSKPSYSSSSSKYTSTLTGKIFGKATFYRNGTYTEDWTNIDLDVSQSIDVTDIYNAGKAAGGGVSIASLEAEKTTADGNETWNSTYKTIGAGFTLTAKDADGNVLATKEGVGITIPASKAYNAGGSTASVDNSITTTYVFNSLEKYNSYWYADFNTQITPTYTNASGTTVKKTSVTKTDSVDVTAIYNAGKAAGSGSDTSHSISVEAKVLEPIWQTIGTNAHKYMLRASATATCGSAEDSDSDITYFEPTDAIEYGKTQVSSSHSPTVSADNQRIVYDDEAGKFAFAATLTPKCGGTEGTNSYISYGFYASVKWDGVTADVYNSGDKTFTIARCVEIDGKQGPNTTNNIYVGAAYDDGAKTASVSDNIATAYTTNSLKQSDGSWYAKFTTFVYPTYVDSSGTTQTKSMLRRTDDEVDVSAIYKTAYAAGWNACISTIYPSIERYWDSYSKYTYIAKANYRDVDYNLQWKTTSKNENDTTW